MITSKKNIKMVFIFITLLIGFIILLMIKNNVLMENKGLVDKIHTQIINNSEVDFDKTIDNFEWDEIFIITPYENPQVIFENENLVWSEIKTPIDYSDSITLIVFLNNKEIVSYVNYPRSKGDFRESEIYERDSSKFIVEIIKQDFSEDWIYLNHIDYKD